MTVCEEMTDIEGDITDSLASGNNTHYTAGIFYKIEDTGAVKILAVKKTENGTSLMLLPGGSQVGVETPIDTFLREMRQELAKFPSSFYPHFSGGRPFVEFRVPNQLGDPPGIHTKYFFMVPEFDGELRDENCEDGDAILGQPTWVEINFLMRMMEGKPPARFHYRALALALDQMAKRKPAIAHKYEKLLNHLRTRYPEFFEDQQP